MPQNIYDEMLQTGQNVEGNEYDQIANDLKRGGISTMRRATTQTKTAPDAKAKAQAIADRLRMPVEMVERNPDLFASQDAIAQTPHEDLLRSTPTLAGWLSDPRNAGVAHDDIDNLKQLDQSITFGASILKGFNTWQSHMYRAAQAVGEVTGTEGLTEFGRVGAERNEAEAAAYGDSPSFGAIRGAWDLVDYAKRVIGEQIPLYAPTLAGGTAGAVAGTFIAGPVGTVIGGGIGAFLPSWAQSVGETEAGLKQKDPTAEAGAAVFIGGTAIAALDTVVPGKIGSRLVRTFGTEAAEVIAQKALAKPIQQRFIRRTVSGAASAMATEGLTEAIQEAIGEMAAAMGTGQPVDWHNLPAQMGEAAAAGALLGGLIGGATAAVTGDPRTAVGQQTEQFVSNLGAVVQNSKLAERLPAGLEDLVTQATTDSPADTLYAPIESWVTYWQGKGLDPADVAAQVTGNAQAFEQAVQTGSDLPIRTSRYAVTLAATEHNSFFAQELRLSPESMNAREAKEFAQAALKAEEQTKEEQPADAPAFLEQFAAVLPPLEAEANAALFDAAFTRLAEKGGVEQSALLKGRTFAVSREAQPGGQSFAQGERARIQFGDKEVRITLFDNADMSSVAHEGAHLFLDIMQNLEGQSSPIKADLDIIRAAYGPDGPEQHERFASGFEAFLLEGKAPSPELRSAFTRFKIWLTDLYQTIVGISRAAGFEVKLTDEVRGVFDRLLASEDAIAAAEAQGRVQPLFTDAASAGVSEEVFANYQDDVRKASQESREQLQRQFMKEVQREQADDYQAKREQVRQEVLASIHQEPVYRASFAIRKGTNPDGTPIVGDEPTPMKLDKRTLVQQYGPEYVKSLPKPYLYTVQEGVHPDTVAELYGFSSGDAMLTAIRTAPPMEQAIETETTRRMKQQYPDLQSDPAALAEEAQAAVFGEGRAKVIAAELKALTQGMSRGVIPPAAVVKQMAEQTIARTKVRNLRPGLYLMAAQRASQRAFEAFAKNDRAAAITAKQQELVALAQFRAARDAKEYGESSFTYFKKFQTKATRSRIGKADPDNLDQIDAILDRYEIARASNKVLDRRASLSKWIASQEAKGLPVNLPDVVKDDARRINWREMTIDELAAVREAIEQIEHLTSLKGRLLKAKDAREFDDYKTDLVESIREHNTAHKLPLEFDDKADRHLGRASWFGGHANIGAIARVFDNKQDGGAFWNAFARPLNEAKDAEETRFAQAFKDFNAILKQHYPKGQVHFRDKVDVPGVGSLSREARIVVALQWGNPQGRDRLLSDPKRKWNQAQIESILNSLDDTDLDLVQAIWPFLDSFWPDVVAKEQRVTGVKPEKVDALPYTVRGRTMRGGYVTLDYDKRLNARAKQLEEQAQAKLVTAASYVSQTTKRGHVKKRNEHVELSLRLDFDVIFGHLEQVIHDLTHHEALIDVTRLLRDRSVQDAIYETRGSHVYEYLTNLLGDVAAGRLPSGRRGEKSITFLRTGGQIALLGLNFWTGVQQTLGLFNGMNRVGGKWVARGLGRWLHDTASLESSVNWIHEKSAFMRHRHQTGTQDLSDLREQLRKPGGWFDEALRKVTNDHVTKQTIIDNYLWHIGMMQRVADVPTWLGQYEKSKANHASDPDAVAMADQAVIDSQGSGRINDLSEVQRGGPAVRLFLMFYSYGATLFSQNYVELKTANYKSPAQVGTLLAHLAMINIMPAIGTIALANLFGRRDDEEAEDWLLGIAGETLSAALSTLIWVREASGVARALADEDTGVRGYAGPAGARIFDLVYRLAGQVKQGELDEALWRAANQMGGVLFRYPAGAVENAVEGAIALDEERTSNIAAPLVGVRR